MQTQMQKGVPSLGQVGTAEQPPTSAHLWDLGKDTSTLDCTLMREPVDLGAFPHVLLVLVLARTIHEYEDETVPVMHPRR